MLISPLGDSAVVIRLGEGVDAKTSAGVRDVVRELERDPLVGMSDVFPAYSSVAVFFQQPRESFAQVQREIEARVQRVFDSAGKAIPAVARMVEIPVCYGGEFGPDLAEVAQHSGLSPEQVVAAHGEGDYLVHAIGFLPGFPYLGGLPTRLATPRRSTPRVEVPAGAVGIGGSQTGVYPIASPGGWNLIGRTPWRLFDVGRSEPALLKVGDRVTFREISADVFTRMSAEERTIQKSSVVAPEKTRDPGAYTIEVTKAGMFTTVQDLGRVGHRREGVPLSGAVDSLAMRVANLLVGNAEDAAGIEFTLVGPELTFRTDTLVALGGADFGVPRWTPFWIRAGDTLALGLARSGCRGYLAVAGGIDVAPVLGSRSTYVRAQLGGWRGRPLRAGDGLSVPRVMRHVQGRWRIDPRIIPAYCGDVVLRVCGGLHAAEFDPAWQKEVFRVSPQSDRMGLRLETGRGLKRVDGAELISMPIGPGTVQVPPDGQPIILLADAQTIGGYPQLAQVATVDLPLVAQLRPGDTVRFELVSLEETYGLLNARERALQLLRQGLAQKLARVGEVDSVP